MSKPYQSACRELRFTSVLAEARRTAESWHHYLEAQVSCAWRSFSGLHMEVVLCLRWQPSRARRGPPSILFLVLLSLSLFCIFVLFLFRKKKKFNSKLTHLFQELSKGEVHQVLVNTIKILKKEKKSHRTRITLKGKRGEILIFIGTRQ